jgi:hypothetical protein
MNICHLNFFKRKIKKEVIFLSEFFSAEVEIFFINKLNTKNCVRKLSRDRGVLEIQIDMIYSGIFLIKRL